MTSSRPRSGRATPAQIAALMQFYAKDSESHGLDAPRARMATTPYADAGSRSLCRSDRPAGTANSPRMAP
jgi:hypothetical protein